MNVIQPILDRRSIRRYEPTPVEDQKIEALLEAARLAPSGGNSQPWRFIVVRSRGMREKLVEACHRQMWMMEAPVFIVCIADLGGRIPTGGPPVIHEWSPEPEVKKIVRDTAIAAEHLVLQARALGLGTCWVAFFEQENIRPVLGVPSDKYVVAVVAVGYPAESPEPRPRRALDEVVFHEKWGGRRPAA